MVDLILRESPAVPIEVKSSESLKPRSLKRYYDWHNPNLCIRTSLAGFKQQEWMQNILLYFLHQWLKMRYSGGVKISSKDLI
jgi:hypothetical protein